MKTLSIEFLRECLEYRADTGELIWKHRPRAHFKSERGYRQTNGKYAGRPAGTVSATTGYVVVNFRGGNLFGAHRLILAMENDVWPDHVDHIDGCRSNNRLENLRACTKSENLCNRGKQSNNTSGFKGVCLSHGRWTATITRHQRTHYLGTFASAESAHAAYKAAAIKYHGAFANAG